MNIYYIDSGDVRFFAKKADAIEAAQEEATEHQKNVNVSRMFIAVDRDNITRMANKLMGFSRFTGRVCSVEPKRRRVRLKRLAAISILLMPLILPNPSDAASCTTRRSGSVTITTCTDKKFFSQCRSYKSGSVIKTTCRG